MDSIEYEAKTHQIAELKGQESLENLLEMVWEWESILSTHINNFKVVEIKKENLMAKI